jgi:signal transduction histidine kinase
VSSISDTNSQELLKRQINAVHTITRMMSSSLDLEDRIRDILHLSVETVEASAGTIYLYRSDDDKLVFEYVVGSTASMLKGMAMSATDGVAGAVFQSGKAQITNRPSNDPSHRSDIGEQIGMIAQSILTVPLRYQSGRTVGVMQLINKIEGDFDHSDLAVIEIIATIAAGAIENARLYREAQLAAIANTVGGLSHDIKNKVTPISAWVETLRPMMEQMFLDMDNLGVKVPKETAEAQAQALNTVRTFYGEAFDAIQDQVHEIQDYTKMIADTVKGMVSKPRIEMSDPNPVIESEIARLEILARRRKIHLIREFSTLPHFPHDSFLLKGAIFNLVNNAITATPEGGCIIIRTAYRQEGVFPAGGFVLIEVKDTGKGMPASLLERILQGDAKSTKPGGTGLGTKIVYNAVKAHHGVFEGESVEGTGTTFRMKLPLIA